MVERQIPRFENDKLLDDTNANEVHQTSAYARIITNYFYFTTLIIFTAQLSRLLEKILLLLEVMLVCVPLKTQMLIFQPVLI